MSEVAQETTTSSDFGGVDSTGVEYTSLAQLPWNKVPSNERIKKLLWWYGSSSAYWEVRNNVKYSALYLGNFHKRFWVSKPF